jgi:hypothetical protein
MSTLPTLLVPEPVVSGDTWPGLSFTIKENGSPIDLTDAEVKIDLYFRKDRTMQFSSELIEEETDIKHITITDATEGKFQVDSIERLDLAPGQHVGDVQVTFSDNRRITYCKIKFNILADITE